MNNYSKQREIILGVIKELKTHPTAEELYINKLKKDNKISKSTVYRNINILLESGQIKKISNPVGPDRYDYVSIDGFNKLDIDLIKIVDVPKDVSEIAFCTDGYRKIFATLKECEEYNKFIKENDPLCYKEYWHERGFVKNQESYDDRAYIRFKI